MKIKIAFFILLAFFVFTGASPWEGAAATAPEGEFPEKGRYVATNSFPRNTVVDIINLETNRSTRVIVASGLENPGLLALVSREAAELIGMRAGSVSRIRMMQPSDPIANQRFKDSLSSGNVTAEEKYREEWYREEPAAPANPPTVSGTPPAKRETTPPVVAGTPPYYLEPEWSTDGRRNIINLPSETEKLGLLSDNEIKEIEKIEEYIAEAEKEPEIETEIEAETEEIVESIPEEETLESEYVAEEEHGETVEPVEEIAEQPPAELEEEPQIVSVTEGTPEYTLVPAEENPPVNDIYGIDPSSIIPGIAMPDNSQPEAEIAAEPVRERPYNDGEQNFSVPRIYELDRGRYYVQVAAHDSPESVESAISHINSNYKPVVYKDGDHRYRILLGPLNQGESAAILKRFKSIGYKDAFVRHVR